MKQDPHLTHIGASDDIAERQSLAADVIRAGRLQPREGEDGGISSPELLGVAAVGALGVHAFFRAPGRRQATEAIALLQAQLEELRTQDPEAWGTEDD